MDDQPTILSQLPATPEAALPPQPTKPSGRKWEKWILIFLVVASVLCAGIYLFVLAKEKTATSSSPIKQKITPSPTATPIPDQTANWKTYTNDKYGFQFNYPANLYLSVDEGTGGYDFCFTTEQKAGQSCSEVDARFHYPGFDVIIEPTNGKTIAQKYAGEQMIKITTLDAQKSKSDEAASVDEVGAGTPDTTIFRKGNYFFEITDFQMSTPQDKTTSTFTFLK